MGFKLDRDRWSQDVVNGNTLRYDAARANAKAHAIGKGTHYVWEYTRDVPNGAGFGMRVYQSGSRRWIQCGTDSNGRPYFNNLGDVAKVSLKEARLQAAIVKGEHSDGVDTRKAQPLAKATLADAVAYYVQHRECAESSKKTLQSEIKNLGHLLQRPIVEITVPDLRSELKAIPGRVEARANRHKVQSRRNGYYHGKSAAEHALGSFSTVHNFWFNERADELQRLGIHVPRNPAIAVRKNRVKYKSEVESIPGEDLAKLVAACRTYRGDNPFPPLLFRFLLATGLRVGAALETKWEYVKDDRILIPATAERAKFRHTKKQDKDAVIIVAITDSIRAVLNELRRLNKVYSRSDQVDVWLFPSLDSERGNISEEKHLVKLLREHAAVYYTSHQLRHTIGTAATKAGYAEKEIIVLGHASTITGVYVDPDARWDAQVKRSREILQMVEKEIDKLLRKVKASTDRKVGKRG